MNGKVRALVGATGVSAVVAAVALSGGTSAYYYDSTHITGNAIKSCKLVLKVTSVTTAFAEGTQEQTNASIVAGNNANGQAPIKITGIAPGDKFETVYNVQNVGTCSGDLWADISHHPGDENSESFNNLWNAAQLSVTTAINSGSTATPGPADSGKFSEVAYRTPDKIASELKPGESVSFTADYGLPEDNMRDVHTSASTTQGQAMQFQVDFGLVQLGHNPNDDGTAHL